ACHLLADSAAECRKSLAVKVSFKSVSNGFVQQDARPAGTQHHRHFASRRFAGTQLDDGLPRSFACEMLGSFFVAKEIQRYTAATARAAVLRRASVFPSESSNVDPRHRLPIR